jgi:uncharacterized membrane protein
MTLKYQPGTALTEVGVEIPSEVFFGTLIGALITGFAVWAVLTLLQFAATWREPARERLVNKLALRVNLMVPDDLRPALTHQVAMRERGRLLGGVMAIAVLAALFPPWVAVPVDLSLAAGPVAIGLVLAGVQLGAITGGAMGRHSAATTESVARMHPLGLAELVHPLERRMALVAAIVAVSIPALALVAVSGLGGSPIVPAAAPASALAVTGLAVGALYLALPAITRRLTARRSLRGDTSALAWSDALTGRALSDLHWLIAFCGGLAAFVSLQVAGLAVPAEASDVATIVGNVVGYAALGLLLVTIAVVLTRSPERHVQRTLWPELAIVAE